MLPPQLLNMNFERISPQDAILATVAYADVFDYPLRRDELTHWMLLNFQKAWKIKEIEMKDGYWYLKGRANIIKLRRQREAWQAEKWGIAQRAAGYLSWIPTLHLVGVTGGLAINNARQDDDIDLLIICARGTLWISRLLATVMISVLGLRRLPRQKHVANKVCLNMFMSPRHDLGWGVDVPGDERDCFSAHEVLQMHPLWEQPGTYRKFLGNNHWVEAYLPNAWHSNSKSGIPEAYKTPAIVLWVFRVFEFPAKVIQLWYMAHHRTNEVITDTILRFHPKDARIWIKRKLSARLAKFNIPLDKVFYAR